jgi:hypothetical protein
MQLYTTEIVAISLCVLVLLYYVTLFFYHLKRTKSTGKAIKNASLLLLPVLALFILIELVFRVMVANTAMKYDRDVLSRNFATIHYIKTLRNTNNDRRFIRLKEHPLNINYVTRAYDGKVFRLDNVKDTLYTLRTDNDGFILPDNCKCDKSIFFLGGSTTECHYVQENNRFPYVVGKILNACGFNYATKNSGVSGNHTLHSIDILINKIAGYNPSYVILMEAFNDLTTLTYEQSYYNRNAFRGLIVDQKSLLKESTTRDEFADKRRMKITVDTSRLYGEYRKSLRLFISACISMDIKPILMTQFNRIEQNLPDKCPSLQIVGGKFDSLISNLNYIDAYKRMNGIIREVAAEKNTPLIDLDHMVPKRATYLYDLVHVNDSGSLLIANIVAEHLMKIIDSTGSKL